MYVGTEIVLVPSQPWVLGMVTHQRDSRTTQGWKAEPSERAPVPMGLKEKTHSVCSHADGKQNHQKGTQCPWCLLQQHLPCTSQPCSLSLLCWSPGAGSWDPAPLCLQGAKADLDRAPAPTIFWWGLHNRVNLR